jgi:hypothetical protein
VSLMPASSNRLNSNEWRERLAVVREQCLKVGPLGAHAIEEPHPRLDGRGPG